VLSGRNSSVSGDGGFTAGVSEVSAGDEVEVGEVVSPGRLGGAGDAASAARIAFSVSRRLLPSRPRPTVIPSVKPITANKSTNIAPRMSRATGDILTIGSVGKFSKVVGMKPSTDSSVGVLLNSAREVLIGSGTKCLSGSDGKLASNRCGKSLVEIPAAEPIAEWPASE
jgi:hypothetical protein